jgi:hypothetical protein
MILTQKPMQYANVGRPTILAIEEAVFKMIMIGGESRQIVQETPSWKYPTQNHRF